MFLKIPSKFNGNNRGERKVFSALENVFNGKTYYAIHSVGLAEHKEKRQGEADFILITDFGIFCIEVKGGGVVRRPDGIWEYSGAEKEDSPFRQAETALYPIEKLLDENDRSRRQKFVTGWGVIFTDIEFKINSPEWTDAEICDSRRFPHNLESYLRGLGEEFWRRLRERKNVRQRPSATTEDIKWALKTIRPDFAHFSLNFLESSREEIIQLEERLYVYLDQMLQQKRSKTLLLGAAGTGKTVLVREAVERIKKDDKVLVICFNAVLARHLRYLFKDKNNVNYIL